MAEGDVINFLFSLIASYYCFIVFIITIEFIHSQGFLKIVISFVDFHSFIHA